MHVAPSACCTGAVLLLSIICLMASGDARRAEPKTKVKSGSPSSASDRLDYAPNEASAVPPATVTKHAASSPRDVPPSSRTEEEAPSPAGPPLRRGEELPSMQQQRAEPTAAPSGNVAPSAAASPSPPLPVGGDTPGPSIREDGRFDSFGRAHPTAAAVGDDGAQQVLLGVWTATLVACVAVRRLL